MVFSANVAFKIVVLCNLLELTGLRRSLPRAMVFLRSPSSPGHLMPDPVGTPRPDGVFIFVCIVRLGFVWDLFFCFGAFLGPPKPGPARPMARYKPNDEEMIAATALLLLLLT